MDSLPAWWTFFWPPRFSQTIIFLCLALILIFHLRRQTREIPWISPSSVSHNDWPAPYYAWFLISEFEFSVILLLTNLLF